MQKTIKKINSIKFTVVTNLIGVLLIFLAIKVIVEAYYKWDFFNNYLEQHIPEFEFYTSILFIFIALKLFTQKEIFLKIIVIYSLIVSLFFLTSSIFLYLIMRSNGAIFSNNYKQIFECFGIFGLSLIFSEFYNYNWKNTLKKFGFMRIFFGVIVLYTIRVIIITLNF